VNADQGAVETNHQKLPDGVDPESSPFKPWTVEAMPYPRGGTEDRAVRQLLGLPEWRPPIWRRMGTALARRGARTLEHVRRAFS
jgi:hypothetical protein